MNILGMGPLEILIVLLVAFIFLGPDRMVNVARMLGKATREFRRFTDELSDAVASDETPAPRNPTGSDENNLYKEPKAQTVVKEQQPNLGPISHRETKSGLLREAGEHPENKAQQ